MWKQIYIINPDPTRRSKEKIKDANKRVENQRERINEERKEYLRILKACTPFEIRFAEAYLKNGGNATDAARTAGSKANALNRVGWNTLATERVQKLIALGLRRRLEAAALDSTEIIQKLRENYFEALENKDFKEANRACELLGQATGMFRLPKGDMGKQGGTVHNYQMSTSQSGGVQDKLKELLAKGDQTKLTPEEIAELDREAKEGPTPTEESLDDKEFERLLAMLKPEEEATI